VTTASRRARQIQRRDDVMRQPPRGKTVYLGRDVPSCARFVPTRA